MGNGETMSASQRAREVIALTLGSVLMVAGGAAVAKAVDNFEHGEQDLSIPHVHNSVINAAETIPDTKAILGGLGAFAAGLGSFAYGANLRDLRRMRDYKSIGRRVKQ